jgi:putative adhesin
MKAWIRRVLPMALLPLFLAGCDIGVGVMHFGSQATADWNKTYQLAAGGRVEIVNINGKIEVEPAQGNTVEVRALKKAKGNSDAAAKAALDRISIAEDVSPAQVRLETKIAHAGGMFSGGSLQVEYHVKVPNGAEVHFTNMNGEIDLTGLQGRIEARTTNGAVRARDVSGQIQARTINGGLDIELAKLGDGGVKLDCTNGGIKLRLPRDAKATISARIVNGGISTGDLPMETTDSSRRHVEGRMNGGGAPVEVSGTNGGISISSR